MKDSKFKLFLFVHVWYESGLLPQPPPADPLAFSTSYMYARMLMSASANSVFSFRLRRTWILLQNVPLHGILSFGASSSVSNLAKYQV